jgi:chemotaxis protein methyltransferase CheR
MGRFDVIFCRNVLIYFDVEAKRLTLERMAAGLNDGGYLVLGGAETVMGVTDAFLPAPERHGLYVKNSAFKRAAA